MRTYCLIALTSCSAEQIERIGAVGPNADARGGLGQACRLDGSCDAELNCTEGLCGAGCEPGRDWECNDVATVSAQWGRCNPDGSCSCHSDTFELNPATGRCRPAAATHVGQACAPEPPCPPGYVCFDETDGSAAAGDGYCMIAGDDGSSPLLCSADAECPSGTLCSPLPWTMASGFCLRACSTADDCRSGHVCAPVELFPGENDSPRSSGPVCWVPPGTGSDVARLDPASIEMFWLPIGSARAGFAGWIPERQLCATVVVWDNGLPGSSRCAPLAGAEDAYVVLTPAAGPPCTGWDYQGATVLSANGCVDFVERTGFYSYPEPTNVQIALSLEIDAPELSGRLVADNRAAAIRFGIDAGAAAGPVVVQVRDATGAAGWLRVERASGEQVRLFDPCCGCGQAEPRFETLTERSAERAVYFTWYGSEFGPGACAADRVPAAAGDYVAELCWGTGVVGDTLTGELCRRVPFRFPDAGSLVVPAN